MTTLLELRERVKSFYSKNSAYLILLFKFILALLFFMNVNKELGFLEPLNNIFVILVLALICSLLSFFATMGIGFLLVIGHCYTVGIEIALLAFILFLIMIIFYLRFAGENALGLILSPLAITFNIFPAIPVGLGLLSGPTSAMSTVCGIIFYYFMTVVKASADEVQAIEKTEVAKRIQIVINGLIKNQTMWVLIFASVAVIVIVYSLRRLAVKYAWTIAIITGGVSYLVIVLGAKTLMNVQISNVALVVQVFIAVAFMFVIKFFAFNVNYRKTESLQYEDDDYHYFVKAVPKIKAEMPQEIYEEE